jgi:flavorubredoxin
MAGFIHMMKEMKFKNKKAAAFGCYGWSGEAVGVMNEMMKDAGFAVIDQSFKINWNPDEDTKRQAMEFGMAIAKA